MTALTFQVDDAVVAKLDEIAAARRVPRENLITEMLSSFLDFEAQQVAGIMAGITDADAGRFATEEELDAIEAEIEARVAARS